MRALEIAPTMAEAHQHLGNLEVEAGRLRQGLARLRLSLELDPKLNASHMTLARLGAYQGKFEEAAERLQTFADSVGEHHPGLLVTRARIAMLQRDMAAFAPLVDTIEHIRGPLAGFARFFRLTLGEIDIAEAEAIRTRANAAFRNPRFLMAMTQVCIEVYACAREYDAALHALGELAGGILVDVVWLDICPLFEPLRNSPAYAEAAAKVRHRAAAIWLP
jgi:serine/threonine-protein kinase